MPAVGVEFTPVQPSDRGLVHATTLRTANRTACDRPCGGWAIALRKLNCKKCLLALHLDARARKKAK